MVLIENLKVGSTFLIFAVSLIGFYAPVYLYDLTRRKHDDETKEDTDFSENPLFMLTKSFSAGVILGVALMHLLPDGQEDLESVSDYPVALACVCAGIILTLCLEQTMAYWGGLHHHHHNHHGHHHDQHNHEPTDHDHMHQHSSCSTHHPEHNSHLAGEFEVRDHAHNHQLSSGGCDETCGVKECPHASNDCSSGCVESGIEMNHDHSHDHTQYDSFNNVVRQPSGKQKLVNPIAVLSSTARPSEAALALMRSQKKAFVKSLVLEISVAIHSVIVGFGFGLLSSVGAVKVLMVAVSLHQLFEGVSLGTMISETSLSRVVVSIFAIIFSLTMPVGVIIGMLTAESDVGSKVKGYANSMAAGSLIYAALVEMIAEIFNSEKLVQHPLFRFVMVLVFSVGCALLGGLAVWA